jgi:glyoxylase-like metal-dependent hydrolase (beta-lactamase superfamily II)
MSDLYEVLAIKYGSHAERTRRDNFMLAGDDHALPAPIDYFVWIIRNAARTIMVDTGFDYAEAKLRGRKITHEPREILKHIGIDPANIDHIVVSHMHYDHAGTLEHFDKARFHIQAAEMAYATGPCMCDEILRRPFTANHVCQMVQKIYSGRVQFHDGEGHVAPGITVHHTPGHSKGIMSTRVMTKRGAVVLASDTTHFYENFEQRKPFPILVNVEDTLKSYDKLERLAESRNHVVPGHDPLVLKRYPAMDKRTEGIVARLDVAPKV